MKISDLKPNTVYCTTGSVSRRVQWNATSTLLATGEDIEYSPTRDGMRGARLYPVDLGPAHKRAGWRTTSEPIILHGFSIDGPLCAVDELPSLLAKQEEQLAAQVAEADVEKRRTAAVRRSTGNARRRSAVQPPPPTG